MYFDEKMKQKKMENKFLVLVFGKFFLIFLSLNVSAVFVGNNTIHNDGCYNYTANRDFNVSNLTYLNCDFKIDSVSYCEWENRSFFTTGRVCSNGTTTPTTTTDGGGGGGGSNCIYDENYDWNCSEWSSCVEGKQTRTCKERNNCGNNYGRPSLEQTCEEAEKIPKQLFDITWNLEDLTIEGVSELVGVVTFESFGTVPTPVNLTFIVLDSDGNEVYREEDNITVTTEEVMRWRFGEEGLSNLADGEYVAVLETLYNVDVFDGFRQEFRVGSEVGITGRAIEWVKGDGKWWISGVIGVVAIGGVVWWFFKKIPSLNSKRRIKRKKKNVSKKREVRKTNVMRKEKVKHRESAKTKLNQQRKRSFRKFVQRIRNIEEGKR